MIAAWFALSAALCQTRPVVVAVIDDAFVLESAPARGFWVDSSLARTLGNPHLAPWDLADRDPDVGPEASRAKEFWHGTATANLLAQRLLSYLGPTAPDLVRFVPIKVLADGMTKPDMAGGYPGIQRAHAAKADVVLCPWAGGNPGEEQRRMVREAIESGALVVAAAGNEATRRPQFPASLPGVLSVAAVDSVGKKTSLSCRGDWVWVSGPGDPWLVPDLRLPSADAPLAHTSRAATEAAALAVALKVRHREWSADKIRQVLMSSSQPLEVRHPGLSGSLGAGRIDPVHAFLGDWASDRPPSKEIHAAGMLPLTRGSWDVSLQGQGSYRGIQLGLSRAVDPRARIRAVAPDGRKYDWSVQDLSGGTEVPYPSLDLRWGGSKRPGGYLEFRKLELDSSTLYCRGTKELSGDSGVGQDGSGPQDYAHDCDCRWSIRVPEGRRIHLAFDTFQTEAKRDQLHVFHGASTRQEHLLALFSGSSLPPALVSPGNELLLWFPSSAKGVGKGFSFRWRAVPESTTAGVILPATRSHP
ncbi:MAG: S8 family serine peptidase [Fibrobacterota bacterium]|nr:MAG: S8 family serine peptidase [Fibrobacterota bacterium]